MEPVVPPRVPRRLLRDYRVWAAVALVVYTLVGFFVVPAVLRRQIPKQIKAYLGRDATLRKVRANPFALSVTLEGLDVRDRDGAALFGFESLYANLQLSGIFKRAIVLRELRILRPDASVRILADGRLSIADLFERPAPPPGETKPGTPRLVIDRLAVQEGRVGYADESRAPRFETEFKSLNLDLRGLSTLPGEEGASDLAALFEGGAEFHWKGSVSVDPPRATGTIRLTGLKFLRAFAYLAQGAPIRLAGGVADVSFDYVAESADEGLRLKLTDGSLSLRGLAVRPLAIDEDWLSVEGIDARGIQLAWPESTVDVASLRVVKPQAVARLEPDGRLNWQEAIADLPSSPSTATGRPAIPWTLACERVEVSDGSVRVEDRSVTPGVNLAADAIAVTLTHLSTAPGIRLHADATAKLSGTIAAEPGAGAAPRAGTVTLSGEGSIDPLFAQADVELAGLPLDFIQPYVARVAKVRVASALAGTKGRLSFDGTGSPMLRFEGGSTLDGFRATDAAGGAIAAWKALAVRDIRLTLSPDRLRVRRVDWNEPFARIAIARDGTLNLASLFADASAPAVAPAPSPFPFDVGTIDVKGGSVDYSDESLVLPFATKVHSAHGSVTDLSSSGAAGSRVSIEGKVEDYGFAQVEGSLRAFDPFAATDLRVLFRNIEMDRLSPYTAEFAGYKIKSGRLDLDVHYRVQERKLVGDHRLVANQLVLGDKAEGTGAGFAVRLAVALLKDKDGKIDLDVPVEGSIDEPEFAYRKVIWTAVKRILVNVATAPFRFLGRMFGFKGDELEHVEFDQGRSDLLPPEREKLAKLIQALIEKPELTVEIGGRYDPESDAQALRASKLDSLIAARRSAAGTAGDQGAIEQILEALYAEQFTPEVLGALRLKYTAAAPEAAAAPATPPAFNGAAFYADIRGQLVAAQAVSDSDLAALATARAQAIASVLTGENGLAANRVVQGEASAVKKKQAGSQSVWSDLTLSAGE